MAATKRTTPVIIINTIIIVLEIIAFIHDCVVFRTGLFQWYTVDSNILQLIVSSFVVYYCPKGKELPAFVTLLHFIMESGLDSSKQREA